MVVERQEDTELVVKQLVIPPMPDGYDADSYVFRELDDCVSELSAADIQVGTVITPSESDMTPFINNLLGDTFVLPVAHFTGSNSPTGPAGGGYMYEYAMAYEYNPEPAEDIDNEDNSTEVGDEDNSETRSLQQRIIDLLQQLVALLTP